MNSTGASQLDILLNFSNLHLLHFNPRWQLVGIHPGHMNFLGWNEITADSFNLQRDFLDPNHLEIPEFLGHFGQKNYVIKNYYWRTNNDHVSGPHSTYFILKKEHGQIKSLMAFIKVNDSSEKIEIPAQDKYNLFISRLLPGLIHNINGPLGTITGRIELLSYKYQDIRELDDLIKMGFKLQGTLENLTFKLVNERYAQPVEINLNRLLREEIHFLESDLFFKHQVQKNEKFVPDIPQFRMHYLALSGIISESYHFFRGFVYEEQEYVLQVGSLFDGKNAGIYLKFMGEFHTPENSNLRFPFTLEGSAVKIAQQQLDGIDTSFLTSCLKQNRGNLEISGRKELLSMHLEFPLPDKSI